MPGLAVAAGAIGGRREADALLATLVRDDYRSEHVIEPGDRLAAIFAGPKRHPLHVERSGSVACALEGAAYGVLPEELTAVMRGFAASYARDRESTRTDVERWALRTDGDFVLLLTDADALRALVVNDRLGRLPLYFAARGGAAAIAREIKFVRGVTGAGEVDRLAIAQLLMFSFPLGARTMHQHISRMPEASSADVDGDAGSIDVRRYYEWDFETLADGGRAKDSVAAELADAFVARCGELGRWAKDEDRPLVVAMSGGLDSRSAAAGLRRAGSAFECVTFESGRKGTSEESATAEEISKVFGAAWRRYELSRPTWADSAKLAARCDGTTNVGMAFMYEFFDRLRAEFGESVCQVTGDGGDRALPDLRDPAPCADRESFVARRIEGALWPVETVAGLLRMKVDEIVGSVRDHVAGYPERTGTFWNVRYLIADYGWGRIFSGEDRTRSFVWTMTPFYAQSFFEAAMRAPARAKRDYALYADFLRALDSRAAAIKKSDWGFAPTSPLVRMRGIAATLRASTPAPLLHALGALRRSRASTAAVSRTQSPDFRAAVEKRPNDVFDRTSLEEIVRTGCGKTHFHMLATAMLYVDGVWREVAPAAR